MWKACIVDSQYGSVKPDAIKRYIDAYKNVGIEVDAANYVSAEAIAENCKEYDAIMCTGNPPITRAVMEALPNLKVVQRYGIGVDSVDLETAKELGIVVLFQAGFCVEELAIHATALILDLVRNVSFMDRGVRNGIWRKAQGIKPPNPEDMVLGLYGFGGSAKPLYRIFNKGFGTKVITYDPYLTPEMIPDYDVELVSFDELIGRSDILSVHVPLTEETRHSLDYDVFCKMKPNAAVINVARGPIIDQEGLIRALKEEQILYAGLDVYEKEPLPNDSELLKMDNVVLTCHSAFWGVRSSACVDQMIIDEMDSIANYNRIPARNVANRGVVPRISDLELY